MSKPFKVGDRVVAYGVDNNNNPIRIYATVTNVFPEQDLIGLGYGACKYNEYDLSLVHPKQCRRLIKKPRRRIWVPAGEYAGWDNICRAFKSDPAMTGYIEFVEVKRK